MCGMVERRETLPAQGMEARIWPSIQHSSAHRSWGGAQSYYLGSCSCSLACITAGHYTVQQALPAVPVHTQTASLSNTVHGLTPPELLYLRGSRGMSKVRAISATDACYPASLQHCITAGRYAMLPVHRPLHWHYC
jgi:hypothetical protein